MKATGPARRWAHPARAAVTGFAVLLGIFVSHVASARLDLLEVAGRGAYSVPGLYDPEVIRFLNGLRLILKQRSGLPTVSVRVRVGLGLGHYECGQRHVPHFLEHMLFDAIPGMPQQALERRFFELGATSNAVTGPTETVYKLAVFSHTAMTALDFTADMLTRAELEPYSFLRTRKVIRREEGGDPGPVESESLAGGRLASGARNALADVARWYFGVCGTWDNGEDVDFGQVEQAYRDYYTPDRMTWVIVGEFDRDAVVDWARRRLADLPAGDAAEPTDLVPNRSTSASTPAIPTSPWLPCWRSPMSTSATTTTPAPCWITCWTVGSTSA